MMISSIFNKETKTFYNKALIVGLKGSAQKFPSNAGLDFQPKRRSEISPSGEVSGSGGAVGAGGA